MYLYEKLDVFRENGGIIEEKIPSYITDNLNSKYLLRKYQENAFQNFIHYFEKSNLLIKPTQTLFHMATGSGKTLIMAGLILFLYKKGYRNFLFFVNSTTIINKTKSNFIDNNSPKYLFQDEINIDGKRVLIKEVSNFQESDEDHINICFQTIQGLHMNMSFPREDAVTFDDFQDKKIVMISDEAHHINAMTSMGRINNEERENLHNWEYTVERIFHSNVDNILLEFTATCDTENEYIKSKYIDKMIFNYPLSKYREDGYSKEVETLQSNTDLTTKMLQAVLLSQYRLKIFQENKLDVKPVILFKSDTISNSKSNMELFNNLITNLTEDDIYTIKTNSSNQLIINMFTYFEENNIDIKNLILEIKDDFSNNKILSVNNVNEAIDIQLIVNTLEEKNNQFRAIFEVKMLDEGWDVLNLFDIVRLYETRDGKNGKPGKKTIQEAQLIGRGARYFPFKINEEQNKYTRKYDNDIENPLRICETLLYHCQMEPRYISELKIALKETGIIPEESKKIKYEIKKSFKRTEFYKTGLVFYNKRKMKNRSKVDSIPDSIRYNTYNFTFDSGKTKTENLFNTTSDFKNIDEKLKEIVLSIKEISDLSYNLVYSAFSKFKILNFNILKQYFPLLKSTKEFITSEKYLGNIKISIKSIYNFPTKEMFYKSLINVFNKIKEDILKYDEVYEGTKEFYSKRFNEIFKDKICNIATLNNDSIGISQNEVIDESYKLDLSDKEWYIYNDNYGTTEEKKFVKYFSENIDKLNEKFDEIYLIRNERELPIYSFDFGERFEPDYLLIIIDNNNLRQRQYQIFIEPKGSHLLNEDKWKEELLISLSNKAIPITKFIDDSEYLIWGFPFFNKDNRLSEFNNSMEKLINEN